MDLPVHWITFNVHYMLKQTYVFKIQMCYKKEKYKICIYCYLNIAWSISIDDISNKICFIYFGSADDCT